MARSNRKKSTPKTISAPGITGQRGINAIEQIVLASGSRWTASGPNEIGIDGYIEMFDPTNHRPLGLTLAVHGKQLLANIRWRPECVATTGLGFTLPQNSEGAVIDKFGQVFDAEQIEAISL